MPVSTTSNSTTQKKIIHENLNYEPNIGMVQLYPYGETISSTLQYPVISVANPGGLRLEFDLLQEDADYINVRYIHCNYDWNKSNLQDIRFLKEYNEFTIGDYSFSQNTRVQYVHYGITLPTPTESGNYIVVAYRNGDKSDILFTRKLLVYKNDLTIGATIRASSLVAKRNKNQQIEFTLSGEDLGSMNPYTQLKVALLQNHNWHTQITGLQPTNMRLSQNQLIYEHFNGENNFPGWNEFRFFDLRSTEFRGINVAHIDVQENHVKAFLGLDQSRKGKSYTQFQDDLEGGYYLNNMDPGHSLMESEYVQVHFELLSPQVNGEVYIAGLYNNWDLSPDAQMYYDQSAGSYKGSLLLKQGNYNYMYWLDGGELPVTYFENSHFQTINNYEILAYYRDPFNNYDELIGYRLISSRNEF